MTSLLLVEEDDARRRALADAFAARGVALLDVPGIFPAMAAFGRADFGVVVVAEGAQNRSVRGLCGMARRWHDGVKLFVVLKDDADRAHAQKNLGDDVVLIDRAAPIEPLVDAVVDALAAQAARAPAPAPAAPTALVLEGGFEGHDGAALLIGLFAQGLTGQLTVVGGPAAGALYLHRGEPAWADVAGGDAALFDLLVGRALLPPDAEVTPVPEGELLAALYKDGRLPLMAATNLQRGLVRDRVMAIAAQSEGSWRFVEDPSLTAPAPPFTVNPFGLVLESLRRSLAPDRLLVVANELERKYLVPEPALSSLADKVAGFVRGQAVSSIVDGTTTVRDFTERTGLDMLMGSLVVLTLLRSKMVDLSDDPRAQDARPAVVLAAPAA